MSWNNLLFVCPEDGIALLTVNRPAKLNALNGETIGELDEAIARVEADNSIRGLIVTGAGEKAFVAGADIQELAVATAVFAATGSGCCRTCTRNYS